MIIYPPKLNDFTSTIDGLSFTVTSSSNRNNMLSAWKAFDQIITKDPYQKWQSQDSKYSSITKLALHNPPFSDGYKDDYYGEWLQIQLSIEICPTSLMFASDACAFRLYASNNEKKWDVLLDIERDETFSTISNYEFQNKNLYSKFAIKIKKSKQVAGYGRCSVMWMQISTIPITSGLISYYNGESYNDSEKQWKDLIGTNHAMSTGNIIRENGLNGNAYICGSFDASIRFPSSILPPTYTIFHIARYNGEKKGRIIVSDLDGESAWLSGFWAGKSGAAFHGKWLTYGKESSTWIQSTDQNNMYRANGVTLGSISNSSSRNIGINIYAQEPSDWAIACMIVYDRTLNINEINKVEDYLHNLYCV